MAPRSRKTTQLQLRVTPREKADLEAHAKRAGLTVSAWVMERVKASGHERLRQIIERLESVDDVSYPLAELNDFLTALTPQEMSVELALAPSLRLSPELANQLAAMVELAAHQKGICAPSWTATIPPLVQPVFASQLPSVRLHLLVHSPPPFRRRNIFVDASVGDRV